MAADQTKEQLAKLDAEIDQRILEHFLEIDTAGNFVNPPSTDDELWEFIRVFFHTKIPRKAVSPHHKAPFDFVSDLFFERTKNALGFANRTGGKTWNVAILNFLDLLFKRDCEIASAGAVLDQANKCYRYFTKFLELPQFKAFCKRYYEKTGREFIVKSIQSWTELKNGSSLEILTGTEKGLRSPHPNKARIDEIDLMEWSVLQTGLSMAQSRKNPAGQVIVRGQNVFTSTRQRINGTMQRLLDEAEAKGITIYEWNIFETLERCTRRCVDDPVHGTCPIYTFCKGKAHHCAGFYSIDDFIEKVRVLDRETWETEWLNKRPARHRLVYNKFDSTRHIMTPERLQRMTGHASIPFDWPRFSGLDFGSSPGHPFVYLKVAELPNGAFLVFHEYVAEQKLLRDHASAIKSSPFWMRAEAIWADWDRQDRLELKDQGIPTLEAQKDVLVGIDYVKSLLAGFPPAEIPQLYIWHTCQYTIAEFGMYSWPVRPDGKIDRSGLPVKDHDHCMDALRYALFSKKRKPRHGGYNQRSIVGL